MSDIDVVPAVDSDVLQAFASAALATPYSAIAFAAGNLSKAPDWVTRLDRESGERVLGVEAVSFSLAVPAGRGQTSYFTITVWRDEDIAEFLTYGAGTSLMVAWVPKNVPPAPGKEGWSSSLALVGFGLTTGEAAPRVYLDEKGKQVALGSDRDGAVARYAVRDRQPSTANRVVSARFQPVA